MLQVLAIVQAIVAALGALNTGGNVISPTTLTSIQNALSKATALLAAFAGLQPPNSIQNDMNDLIAIVGAIEQTGVLLADQHLADIQAIIDKFAAVEANLDSGQFALFFKFQRNGKTVDVGGFEEGGAFAQSQLGG